MPRSVEKAAGIVVSAMKTAAMYWYLEPPLGWDGKA